MVCHSAADRAIYIDTVDTRVLPSPEANSQRGRIPAKAYQSDLQIISLVGFNELTD